MKKVSDLKTLNPIKYFYCPLCREVYENDVDRVKAYCPIHGEMMAFFNIEDVNKFNKRTEEMKISAFPQYKPEEDLTPPAFLKRIMD
jgi:hypothetical protein